jgi:hypothetical protein
MNSRKALENIKYFYPFWIWKKDYYDYATTTLVITM